jgi:hypothetical protein
MIDCKVIMMKMNKKGTLTNTIILIASLFGMLVLFAIIAKILWGG